MAEFERHSRVEIWGRVIRLSVAIQRSHHVSRYLSVSTGLNRPAFVSLGVKANVKSASGIPHS